VNERTEKINKEITRNELKKSREEEGKKRNKY
jgi:hypothetical protein